MAHKECYRQRQETYVHTKTYVILFVTNIHGVLAQFSLDFKTLSLGLEVVDDI